MRAVASSLRNEANRQLHGPEIFPSEIPGQQIFIWREVQAIHLEWC